ncbi:hypothetical protein D9619_006727 [Psilocybe cf. subviscida]|uniref:Uncharacterized protein n=1 Tax=Psilocybe cf. subviscida TaxID=2480587 RepID=A0A8H5B5Z2_9AGAR|nr:hypothetical protein D9619_006727 [Psilocybe cf. subviscida]
MCCHGRGFFSSPLLSYKHWVRYEQQVKESEQADLTKTVIEKVVAALKDEKTQKDILAGAVAEIEQLVKSKVI